MDMGKYVAVGVLAVIVLAAVTYEAPQERASSSDQSFSGSFEGAQPKTKQEEPVPNPVTSGAVATPTGAASPSVVESRTPTTPSVAEPATANADDVERLAHYTVKAGQTLSDIAGDALGDRGRWMEIYEQNKDRIPNPDQIRQGMTLFFTGGKSQGAEATPSPQPAQPTASPAPVATASRTYTVVAGDTLYSIAKRELGQGSRWKEIISVNDLPSEHLTEGMKLQMP